MPPGPPREDVSDEIAQTLRRLQTDARQVRGWTPPGDPLRRSSELLSETLAALRDTGVSISAMARAMGVSRGAVQLRLQRHGYARPKPSAQVERYGKRSWAQQPKELDGTSTCKRNHAWNEENVRVLPDGRRWCILCDRQRGKEYRERKRAAAMA